MSHPNQSPPQIPDYTLVRLIGRGSYGDVWLARGVTGAFRAVKLVWRDRFTDPRPYAREFEGITRFTQISLREPSQLALLHTGRDGDDRFFYYVMELADDARRGREIKPESYTPLTLKAVREGRDYLPASEVIELGVTLARALSNLHANGLVHRDIKPSNIVLVGGVPKLADVGLVAAASAGLTFVGTEGFVPPEGPGAPAADVFSLGKVLYELATGLDRQDFPRLPPNLAEWPDRRELLELNEILLRACEPNPANRFANAGALLDELLLLQAGKSVRRLRSAERRTARALRVAGALALIAAVAGTGAYVQYLRAEKAVAERIEISRRATYSGNLAKAQRALDHGDLAQARRVLDELRSKPGEEDLRGFEWRALWHEAQGDPHEVLRPAGGPEIDRLALSPDESLLAVRDKTNTLTLYDTATRRELRRITGLWAFAEFSSDGAWVVGTDTAMVTRRWSVRDGMADVTAANIGLPIHALGPTTVAAISREGPSRLCVWDFRTARETLSLALDTSTEGARWGGLLSEINTERNVIVRVWITGSGNNARFRVSCIRLGEIPTIQNQDLGASLPGAIGFDTSGPWAFVSGGNARTDGELWRCDAAGWRKTNETLPAQTSHCVEFAALGQRQRLIARRRELAWLDGTGALIQTARGHEASITDIAVCRGQQSVFSAAADGSLFCWPLHAPATTTFVPKAPSAGGYANAVFTLGGKSIWVAQNDGTCVRLDTVTLSPASSAPIACPVTIRAEGLIGLAPSAGLMIVDPTTGAVQGARRRSTGPWKLAAAALTGQIAGINYTGNLIDGTTETPSLRTDFEHVFFLCLDPAGHRLYAGRRNRELLCLAWPEGRELWRHTLSALAVTLLVEPDGARLIAGLDNGTLEFLDANTGLRCAPPISAGTTEPMALAQSPREPRVVIAGAEGGLHYFDTATWSEIHVQPLHLDAPLHRLAFSADGHTLAVLTGTGVLRVVRTN